MKRPEGGSFALKRTWYVLFFPCLCGCLYACKEEVPLVVSMYPRIGMSGDILTIEGSRFGAEQLESYITIAGISPTGSSYLSWQDDRITLRIPALGESGLVYVHKDGKKSNPLLFSNRVAMPELVQNRNFGLAPQISSIKPESGAIGALISIQGSGFGASRERSGVFFAWNAEPSPAAPELTQEPERVEVFEIEFGYELWSEREIRLRIPDGAVSGNILVRTPSGSSKPVLFTITGNPGTKTFKEKRSYTIAYTVDIQVQEAKDPNTLYLWIPHPVSSASQRNVTLLSRNKEPFAEHYQGTTLFQLTDLPAHTSTRMSLSYLVDVYTLETTLRSQAIRQTGDSPIPAVYTLPSALIPSDNPDLAAAANGIIGRERNPYEKARKLYEWLIHEGGIQWTPLRNSALEALAQKQADAYSGALLFCALARAVAIPAIPVSGVLINRARLSSRHYWAEFWIEGFGWISVDPCLGAGAVPADFNLRHDPEGYYFGNLDNQRITFSRGQGDLSQMDPRGRITVRNRDYAMQNLWEEAIGGIESYSSLWSDITITGMYVQ
ncbi:MAG: IPT/TIG domain-containing protein [Treponema sp.]|jgi:transglutaminase-like putative cysteine protease|nr:IPT/TIG domain-containing protein [Treponema sp.]